MSFALQSLRSWSSRRTIAPEASRRAGARACWRRRSAVEPHDLRLRRKEAEEQPRQPDRLLAQRRAGQGGVSRRGVALVEDEVDHRGDGGEPRGPLRRGGGLERDVGALDSALGARDPLLHGGLAHQEGAGDLLHREAAHDAQGERDLRRRRQVGVAADEEETEHVVAVVAAVELLGDRRLAVLEIRDHVIGGERALPSPPTDGVDGGVAPDEDQPGGRIAGRAVLRPVLERAEGGLLEGLLGRVEVTEVVEQRADRLRARGRQRRVDPAHVAHLRALRSWPPLRYASRPAPRASRAWGDRRGGTTTPGTPRRRGSRPPSRSPTARGTGGRGRC